MATFVSKLTLSLAGVLLLMGLGLGPVGVFVSAVAPDPNNCGVPKIPPVTLGRNNGRIVGGNEARRNSWPWQVQIAYINGTHFCGGSLLSQDWVLTAAHCFQEETMPTETVDLHFGIHNNSNQLSEPYRQSSRIRTLIMHNSYRNKTGGNDIALLRLATPVNFTAQVSPICLPSRNKELPEGTPAYVTGWGDTQGTGDQNLLQQVMVPIISRETCNRPDYYHNEISQSKVCAGYELGSKDACGGDSGGPLVSKIGTRWEQFGIVSYGEGCGDYKKPGVYANVVYLKDWILQQVNQE